ncbi:UNVERIFIED_CONTAM: Ribonuclease HI [Sesamum radiatum]|uniref:Ribonuclease HI n=1 Tax=Sesamum radiatum TaxID=300843 RepID=A0AAW2QGQ5_SESRA
MKLKPAKCAFGVRSGKFIGYLVIEKGIGVNPEKTRAIQDMKPPANLDEVQRLAGCIVALSRLISRSAEWSLPFFKALRKNKGFVWDEKCQHAFQDLKTYLAQLPLLTKPVPGETIYLYLAAVPQAGSWPLHADGSSTLTGSRAGVVLTSPKGDELEYALHFDFKASNNKAEYEALIVAIKIALDTGAEDLIAYTDSQLVTKHIEGEYEVKEERMKGYLQEIGELTSSLRSFQLYQIPRMENTKVDYLAQLASSMVNCNTRNITDTSGRPSRKMRLAGPEDGGKIQDWCEQGIQQCFTSIAHPQATRAEAVIPAEAGLETFRIQHYEQENNYHLMKANLDLIEEVRENAQVHMERYKQKIVTAYNGRVRRREFQVGDLVLQRVSALEPVGKLSPN